MQEPHRIAERPQLAPLDETLRQRLGGKRGIGRHRARDHLAQRFLCKACRGRIHGREPVRQRGAGLDDGELRMHDLAPEMTLAHFAEHAHAPSDGQCLLLVRVEMEKTQDELCASACGVGAVLEETHELPPRPVLDVRRDDGTFRLLLAAWSKRSERNNARVILVAQRQMQDEIRVARNAQARELVGERRAGLLAWRARFFLASHAGPLAIAPSARARLRFRGGPPWAERPPDRSRAMGKAA